jgi:hypothetical protein
LARLDDHAVPALAAGLRTLGRAGRRLAGATGPAGRWLSGFSRRQPTIVVAAVSVVVAAVLLGITGGDRTRAVRPVASSVVPPLTSDALGPTPGMTVAAYLQQAGLRRQQLAALPPGQRLAAVVDLTGYLTPQAVATELSAQPQVQVLRAFARVAPPANAPLHVLTLGVGGTVSQQLATDRDAARQVLSRFRLALAASAAHPASARLRQLIAAEQPQVPAARVDARSLGPACGCIFALLVAGPAAQLQQVAGLTDVRVLDPAPPSSSAARLMVVPLEPQVTGVVEPLQFAGD